MVKPRWVPFVVSVRVESVQVIMSGLSCNTSRSRPDSK